MDRFRKAVFGGARALVATLALALSLPAAHAADTDADAFFSLRDDDARVAAVGYALASRNRAFCATAVAPLTGLTLHALGQYRVADRATVTRLFGMTRWPGVMAVVAGSPADRAGIHADDQLVAVGGIDLGEQSPAGGASRDLVEHANRALAAELAKGPAVLTVERQGRRMELTLVPESGCASDVELLSSDAVNAWADGRHVMIGGGLFDACAHDDALALVIAHEMAHNLIDARARLTGGAEGHGRSVETEADTIAVKMLVAAGYDPQRAIDGLGKVIRRGGLSFSHPAPGRRIAALEAAIGPARP